MSSIRRRPRVIVNGVQRMRTHHYYWCLQCQRTARISSAITDPNEIFCPHCLNYLHDELDISRPRLRASGAADLQRLEEPSPAAQLLDSLAQMLQNPNFDRRVPRNPETETGNNRQGWIILQFRNPIQNSRPISPPENFPATDPIESNNDDGFEELIQELTQNDRPGPLPASISAIDALPTVNLTQTHLENDSVCPICKEEFEIGGEVREMPCKHFYHSDCIIPWLRIHNSCPVCRFELRGYSSSDDDGAGAFRSSEELWNGLSWLWTRVLSLWPFRLLPNWNLNRDLIFPRRRNISFSWMYPLMALLAYSISER